MIQDTKNIWWPKNEDMISKDPYLQVLVHGSLSCMTWSRQIMTSSWKEGRRDNHILMGGHRGLAQIKASLDLVFLGYYAEAGAILRGAFEITNMLACTIDDADLLEDWKVAKKEDYMGGGKFTPAKLRRKSCEILNVPLDMQDARYGNLCKISTHPDNEGIFFFEPEGSIGSLHRCDPNQCKGLLEEIALQSYLLLRALFPIQPDSLEIANAVLVGYNSIDTIVAHKGEVQEMMGISNIANPHWVVR